ncbi:MAG: hypothetical protein U0270_13300 [Labilithrix sp.]
MPVEAGHVYLIPPKKEMIISGGELDVLYRDRLIGVTCFFRNEEAFAMLEEKILPELAANKRKGEPLRVWARRAIPSRSCSTS